MAVPPCPAKNKETTKKINQKPQATHRSQKNAGRGVQKEKNNCN